MLVQTMPGVCNFMGPKYLHTLRMLLHKLHGLQSLVVMVLLLLFYVLPALQNLSPAAAAEVAAAAWWFPFLALQGRDRSWWDSGRGKQFPQIMWEWGGEALGLHALLKDGASSSSSRMASHEEFKV